jgi:hypothetical protein
MAYGLYISPSRADFSEAGHDGFLLFKVEGGGPRLRKDKHRSNSVVRLTWDLPYNQFLTLISAYRNHRDEDWEIEIVNNESGLSLYNCRLLPGSFGFRVEGLTYHVYGEFEVMSEVTV